MNIFQKQLLIKKNKLLSECLNETAKNKVTLPPSEQKVTAEEFLKTMDSIRKKQG